MFGVGARNGKKCWAPARGRRREGRSRSGFPFRDRWPTVEDRDCGDELGHQEDDKGQVVALRGIVDAPGEDRSERSPDHGCNAESTRDHQKGKEHA